MQKISSIMLGMLMATSAVFASSCSTSQNKLEGPFNVTIKATQGGRVSVPIEQVNFGENVPVSVQPAQGYRVKEFKINGEKITIVGDTYTEYCVTEDLLIEVTFASKYTTVQFDTAGRRKLSDKKFTINSWYGTLPEATSDDPDDLFMGWYTQPDGKGEYVVNSSRVPEEPHTLYAYFVSKYMVDGSTLNKELYKEYALTTTYFDEDALLLGVSYHTAEECYYPVVQYAEGHVDAATFDAMEGVEEVACKKTSTKLDWKNTAVLELNPETEYTVRIGDRGSRLYGDVYHFTTNAEEKEETKFLFMANSKQTTSGYEEGSTAFAKTLDVATDYFTAEDMDFLVHGGDYTSSGMMPKYWAGMLDGYKEYAFDMPMVPVAGEMEYYTNTNKTTNVFENMFHIDAPSQTTTHGLYYSFNLGPVHVSVLNSNDCVDKHNSQQNTAGGLITGTGSLVDQQLNWLTDDLDYTRNVNSYIKWNIVVMHESLLLPAYANTDDQSLRANHAMSLREQLMSVLTEQKVDLVLSAQDGESFTTNPLVYDANNAIAIQPIAGQKAGETVYEQWIKTVETPSANKEYNGFNVLSFDEYQSGEMGTVFHQVGAIGLGKTSNFQYSQMADNLAKYGNIYNHLVSGIQNGKELSMFSCIELNETTLTLRTYGVAMNEQYASLGELPYFGGIQLKK